MTNHVKRNAFTLAEGATHVVLLDNFRNAAFTLAEELITLGIIGIVAALTLPTLVAKHRAETIEKKLAKYYTNMNQAFTMSELENGSHENWDYTLSSWDFYNKYLAKYLQTVKVQKGFNGNLDNDTFVGIFFPDGTMAVMGYTRCLNFFPKANTKYNTVCSNIELENQKTHKYGKETFAFKICQDAFHKLEPYGKSDCNGTSLTDEEIMEDCKNQNRGLYCTELIRRNGWKIPENYPVKL